MMKGYYTDNGYMGYINGSYRLFVDESDYRECLEDQVVVWVTGRNNNRYIVVSRLKMIIRLQEDERCLDLIRCLILIEMEN